MQKFNTYTQRKISVTPNDEDSNFSSSSYFSSMVDQRDCRAQVYPNTHREMRNSDYQNDEDGPFSSFFLS